MAFKTHKRVENSLLKSACIALSQTLKVGDAIIPGATGHNKFVLGAANTTGNILGVVVAITGLNGKVLELDSVTTGASNETAKTYWVTFIPASTDIEFVATLDAAAGTTTNSDGIGSFNVSTTDSSLLIESGVALFSATTKQFVSFGVDSNDSTNLTVIGHFNRTLVL